MTNTTCPHQYPLYIWTRNINATNRGLKYIFARMTVESNHKLGFTTKGVTQFHLTISLPLCDAQLLMGSNHRTPSEQWGHTVLTFLWKLMWCPAHSCMSATHCWSFDSSHFSESTLSPSFALVRRSRAFSASIPTWAQTHRATDKPLTSKLKHRQLQCSKQTVNICVCSKNFLFDDQDSWTLVAEHCHLQLKIMQSSVSIFVWP